MANRHLHFQTEEQLDQATRTLRRAARGGVTGKRRHARHKDKLTVTLRDEWGWGPIKLETEDIGPDGLFVVSDLLFKEGDGFLLEFESPATGEKLVVWSRVVRVAQADWQSTTGDAGMGFEFVDLATHQRAALAEYVSRPVTQ